MGACSVHIHPIHPLDRMIHLIIVCLCNVLRRTCGAQLNAGGKVAELAASYKHCYVRKPGHCPKGTRLDDRFD